MDIPRIHKETTIFDPDNTIEGNVSEAGTKATDYVTDITGGGIMVHPSDDSTSGWKISSAIELLKSGVSYIKMWLDGSTPKLRLGRVDKAHVTLADSSMDVSDGSASVASFGSTARIGKDGSNPRFLMNSTSLEAYDANGKYFSVSRGGMSFGGNDVAKGSDIPTKVSDLSNDSSFATTGQVGTAKSEAISAAATDATSKANAAQSAAISAAATDATSKANAAQSAAEANAAADATTKANNAAKTASNYISDTTDNGIMVHPAGDSTSGWKIAAALELLKNGVTAFKVWLDGNNMPKLRLGREDKAHVDIDFNSMKLIDADAKTFFDVKDMRDSSRDATVTETFKFKSGGFYLLAFQAHGVQSVKVDGASSQYTTQTLTYTVGSSLSFTTTKLTVTRPTSGSEVTVTYTTRSDMAKSLSFGMSITGNVGGCGSSFGIGSKAVGLASHAEGIGTEASGWASHSEGVGTIAAAEGQTAVGKYNVEDDDCAFIVGVGTSDSNRSNAFAVKKDGSVVHDGDVYLTNNNSGFFTPESGITVHSARYKQWGGMAMLWLKLTSAEDIGVGPLSALGTLASGKRPPFECCAPMVVANGDVTIDNDGVVSCRPRVAVTAGTNIYVRVTYLLA